VMLGNMVPRTNDSASECMCEVKVSLVCVCQSMCVGEGVTCVCMWGWDVCVHCRVRAVYTVSSAAQQDIIWCRSVSLILRFWSNGIKVIWMTWTVGKDAPLKCGLLLSIVSLFYLICLFNQDTSTEVDGSKIDCNYLVLDEGWLP